MTPSLKSQASSLLRFGALGLIALLAYGGTPFDSPWTDFGSLRAVKVPPPKAETAAQDVPGPRLIVILVIDQMRAEYLTRYDRFWKGGVRRLLNDGAYFEQTYYPYLITVTCAGHATIGTGALPATHGILQNEWWNRQEQRREPCTADRSVATLAYHGRAEVLGHSARKMRLPTLADRLRQRSPASRVVTLSMKPRSTIMLAGHGGIQTWFSSANAWSTSTAVAKTLVPEVKKFIDEHPIEAERQVIWNRVYEASVYAGEDAAIGERPQYGREITFPHPLDGPSTDRFYDIWERSPFSDAYLARMAASLVRDLKLGQRDTTDFLGISFSGLDYVGHDFGPDSHEVQDTLIRLDRTLNDLFDALDSTVGRDRYAVGVSADHGVSPIPEQRRERGLDAGRIVKEKVHEVAEAAMVAAHGPGPHVALVEYTDLYLTDAARARAAANAEFLRPLLEAISKMDGVLRVFPTAGLEQKRASSDEVERAAALSYFPGESGDVMIVPKPYWLFSVTSQATHGTHHPYDQHVPLIFMGPAFKPGRYAERASPADLAPTLASLINLPIPGVEGRVLTQSLR